MKNIYIKTITVVDENSLNEVIWINNNEVYKTQYRGLNISHADILKYHFTTYPKARADIFEFLKKDKKSSLNMCYSYSSEDKTNIDATTRIYFLENGLIDEMLIREESLNNETLEIGTIRKYSYNKEGEMTYLFEYFSNGKLLHIVNFLDTNTNINDFDNPFERINWSQISFIENPKEYYFNGLEPV